MRHVRRLACAAHVGPGCVRGIRPTIDLVASLIYCFSPSLFLSDSIPRPIPLDPGPAILFHPHLSVTRRQCLVCMEIGTGYGVLSGEDKLCIARFKTLKLKYSYPYLGDLCRLVSGYSFFPVCRYSE
jgi:hypothetical protein